MTKIHDTAIIADVQKLLSIASRRNKSLPFLDIPQLSAEIRRLIRHAYIEKAKTRRRAHEDMIHDLMRESCGAEMLLHGRISIRQCPRWMKPSGCRQAGESIDTYIPRYFRHMDAAPDLQRAVEIANGGTSWRKLRQIYTRWALARRRELAAIEKAPAAMTRLRQLRHVMEAAVATLDR